MSSGRKLVAWFGVLGAIWGILGLSLIFCRGLICLYPYVEELPDMPFEWIHWAGLAGSLLFMGYAEGYRGFHQKFSPRAAARALYLKNKPTPVRVVLFWGWKAALAVVSSPRTRTPLTSTISSTTTSAVPMNVAISSLIRQRRMSAREMRPMTSRSNRAAPTSSPPASRATATVRR